MCHHRIEIYVQLQQKCARKLGKKRANTASGGENIDIFIPSSILNPQKSTPMCRTDAQLLQHSTLNAHIIGWVVLVLEYFLCCTYTFTCEHMTCSTVSLTHPPSSSYSFISFSFFSLISLSFLNDILRIIFHKQDINRHMSVLFFFLFLVFFFEHQHARDYRGGTWDYKTISAI